MEQAMRLEPGKFYPLSAVVTDFEIQDGKDLIEICEDDRTYLKFSCKITSQNVDHLITGVISCSELWRLEHTDNKKLEEYIKESFYGNRDYEIYIRISAIYLGRKDD